MYSGVPVRVSYIDVDGSIHLNLVNIPLLTVIALPVLLLSDDSTPIVLASITCIVGESMLHLCGVIFGLAQGFYADENLYLCIPGVALGNLLDTNAEPHGVYMGSSGHSLAEFRSVFRPHLHNVFRALTPTPPTDAISTSSEESEDSGDFVMIPIIFESDNDSDLSDDYQDSYQENVDPNIFY